MGIFDRLFGKKETPSETKKECCSEKEVEGIYDYEDGPWENYWYNGQVKYKGNWKDGKEDGLWEHYFEDGKLYSEGHYKVGKKDGLWKYYWSTYYSKIFQLQSEGSYIDGEEEGIWKYYYPIGQLKEEKNYTKGVIISQKCWDVDGNKIGCDK